MTLKATVANSYPENVQAHIGSFLSGKRGTLPQQRAQLQANASNIPGAPGVSRRSRKARKSKARKSKARK